MEDELIIELYFTRDELAITETDHKYGAFCHRIAMNILSVREDAEECVNDTYHAAWHKLPPELPNSLRAFLGRITRNLSISRFRKNRAQKRYDGLEVMLSELGDCVPSSDTVEQAIETEQLSELISDWLVSLPADDCALFVRRYWHGDAVQALAKECGITQNQMAQRMLRLRKSLKADLEAEGVAL